jgi:hypothetical protein
MRRGTVKLVFSMSQMEVWEESSPNRAIEKGDVTCLRKKYKKFAGRSQQEE